MPVPSQLSAPCHHFAAGGNDPGLCANLRREALKALPPGSKLRECEPVVVKRVM